ncbi:hypothetical protein NDU88_009932 [Pleurodeles waltl]|uniref:Uncharacterized protein n=1 Tax=Pleurodeles waltl TaxID=8319 RepID=A0AAV7PWR5_PLEWA|nr:hypothetical protein NDU88_009932 [Pleurodeles waltl]
MKVGVDRPPDLARCRPPRPGGLVVPQPQIPLKWSWTKDALWCRVTPEGDGQKAREFPGREIAGPVMPQEMWPEETEKRWRHAMEKRRLTKSGAASSDSEESRATVIQKRDRRESSARA